MHAGPHENFDIHLESAGVRPKLRPKLSVYVWLTGRFVTPHGLGYNCPASSFFPAVSVNCRLAMQDQTTLTATMISISHAHVHYAILKMSTDQAFTW